MASKINDLSAVTIPLGTMITNIVSSPYAPGDDHKITLTNLFQGGALDWKTTGATAFGSDATFGIVNDITKYFDFGQTTTDFSGAQQWNLINAVYNIAPTGDLTGNDIEVLNLTCQVPSTNTHSIWNLTGFTVSVFVPSGATGDIGELIRGGLIGAEFRGTPTNPVPFIAGIEVYSVIDGGVSTVTQNVGMDISAYASKPGITVLDNRGIWIYQQSDPGALITDNYGLIIDDLTVGTNKWAIKTGVGLVDFGDTVQTTSYVSADLGFRVGGNFSVDDSGTLTAAGPSTFQNSLEVQGDLQADANVFIGTTSGGTGAQKCLVLSNTATAPSDSVDRVQLYAVDLSAGNATLGLFTERAVVTETVSSDRTLSIQINGTTYKLLLHS